MRRAAALVIALAGCNWVYGLDPTKPAPDAPDAPPEHVPVPIHLAFLQARLVSGSPVQPVDLAIGDLVRLEASTTDGAAPVTLTADATGTIQVPYTIASMPWRLVYQRQGEVVHEVQGLVSDAHVIEPLFGPVARTPPAGGTGYLVQPSNYPGAASHAINRVFTVGTWTEGTTPLAPAGANLDYEYAGAASLSGPLGAPVQGDRATLVDYQIANSCRTSKGSVEFDAANIGPPHVTVTGTWDPVQTQVTINTPLAALDSTRVSPLGESAGPIREVFGYLASKQMPAFTRPPDASRSVLLRNPVLLTMRSCPLPYPSTAPLLHEPGSYGAKLPRAVHTEIVASRTLPAGASLVNGIAIVTTEAGGMFAVGSTVAAAGDATLGTTNLFGTSERIPLPSRSGQLPLTWRKTMDAQVADFWEVSLLEVQGSSLVERRVYTTPTPSLTIDGADLAPQTEYVLRFTAFAGRAAAATGDYRQITGDQSISIVHARSFVTP